MSDTDPFSARTTFDTGSGEAVIYRLDRLEAAGLGSMAALPYSIRYLLESALRNIDGFAVTEDDVRRIAGWKPGPLEPTEIPFLPARVVLQDFTGVPCVVDLAAMRDAMTALGGDPTKINPLIPVDLVIDHSVQVDLFGTPEALEQNVTIEFDRNKERYEFLRWGQKAFDNFRVVPPNTGIVHQVNLEFLAKGVFLRKIGGETVAVPDTLVGTDSHTTMINGLGVLGWGVGGIEAEAVMLGQPLYMLLPEVVGFELTGELPPGATATDLVLTVTQTLRKHGVVNKFVEFYGSGIAGMPLSDRATIANMAPEYGATIGFFPVDAETLLYMRRTGRTEEEVTRLERYCREQGLFVTEESPVPSFSAQLHLDLSTVVPSLAGPKRPQDRVPLGKMKETFYNSLRAPVAERGFGLADTALSRTGTVQVNGHGEAIGHGAVVIAAITSCTNTSNPGVMLAAGLLAKKAVEKGLTVPPWVKTSLAPGSRVVTDYYEAAGVTEALDALRFNTVGYGCTTCIGNSGPLPEPVAAAVLSGDLVAAAVLSGNRNFEGRVNPLTKANFLASPPLVVAYALAGTVDIDFETEPLGTGSDGEPVFLKDVWPTRQEVLAVVEDAVRPEMFHAEYGTVYDANPRWNAIHVAGGATYEWDPASTYIQRPPFLEDLSPEVGPIGPLTGARVLALLGDSITTDHISPAGSISKSGPAGKFLLESGVPPQEFNSYGSRRGNDRVMVRGTFANIRIRNQLAPGTEGGVTRHLPTGEVLSIYDAATRYQAEGTPLIVLAGEEYGTGSSRDWAAKGTLMLGVKAVIAASYERIHRSNLVFMGILPLEFDRGQTWHTLGLTGEEVYSIPGLGDDVAPRQRIEVRAEAADGTVKKFDAIVRIDSPVELLYYKNGGILNTVVRKLLAS